MNLFVKAMFTLGTIILAVLTILLLMTPSMPEAEKAEVKRGLELNLKQHEIEKAVDHYTSEGIDPGDISGKMLNDYIEATREGENQ